MASESAEDELEEGNEDEDRERERLAALAALGRANFSAAVGLLLAPLQRCTAQLRSYCEVFLRRLELWFWSPTDL